MNGDANDTQQNFAADSVDAKDAEIDSLHAQVQQLQNQLESG